MIVMDVDWGKYEERNPRILLNPEIVRAEGKPHYEIVVGVARAAIGRSRQLSRW